MPASTLRSLSPSFVRSVELDYVAPLVTVPTTTYCKYPPVMTIKPAVITSSKVAFISAKATSPCGGTITYLWSYASGPGTVVFTPSNGRETVATVSLSGLYAFKLVATDGHWSIFGNAQVFYP